MPTMAINAKTLNVATSLLQIAQQNCKDIAQEANLPEQDTQVLNQFEDTSLSEPSNRKNEQPSKDTNVKTSNDIDLEAYKDANPEPSKDPNIEVSLQSSHGTFLSKEVNEENTSPGKKEREAHEELTSKAKIQKIFLTWALISKISPQRYSKINLEP